MDPPPPIQRAPTLLSIDTPCSITGRSVKACDHFFALGHITRQRECYICIYCVSVHPVALPRSPSSLLACPLATRYTYHGPSLSFLHRRRTDACVSPRISSYFVFLFTTQSIAPTNGRRWRSWQTRREIEESKHPPSQEL